MTRSILRLFVASLARRRLASALSLLAIALGVALGLAVQLIHDAALDEFGRGMRTLAGEADLQVRGGRAGFDEGVYLVLAQRPEVAEASPVVEIEARLPARTTTLRVYGIDVFRLASVQPALMPRATARDPRFAALAPDAVFLSTAAQQAVLDSPLQPVLTVQSGVREAALRVAGVVPGAGVGQSLAVMDIAAAQETFGMLGRLNRVDLKLAPGVDRAQARASLGAILPAGVTIAPPDAPVSETTALTRAYRVNLSMLAAIALLTGGFLVFSTQWLAVVRRRREFALLRALGMARRTLMRGLLAEGGVTGLAGGIAGVALGHLLAMMAFILIGGDLGAGYFASTRPTLQFSPWLIAGYLALGVAAGLAGAWLPAREAASMAPASGLRAGAADSAVHALGRSRLHRAVACIALAAVACVPPPMAGIPVGGYVAVAFALAAAVLVLPSATVLTMRLASVRRGVIWRLAHARLAAAPGQSIVAGAGVVASVALASAMAIMVSSFRVSVDDWLVSVLPADLYLRASSAGASGFFDADALARIRASAGVDFVEPVRAVDLRLIEGRPPVTLLARSVSRGWGLSLVSGSLHEDGSGLPGVWISEAVADLLHVAPGDTMTLPLDGRAFQFSVAGVWRDYARQNGAVVVDLQTYRRLSGDDRVNDVAIRLVGGTSADTAAAALRDLFGAQTVEIALPGEIRAVSLKIFDRTFVVTYLMEAVAIVIGLFGIATTFAALTMARRGEFGMLRHIGLDRHDIGMLIAVEGALCAAVGVGVGLMAGGSIAWILIEVVNRQSFHWSMDIHVPVPGLVLFSLGLVGLAAAVARLAGYRAMRQRAVLAVREDW